MAESLHLYLAGIGERTGVDDVTNVLEQGLFRSTCNLMLQLIGDVKVIFDGAFAPPRHHTDVGQTRLDRLLHPILDERLVDDRQHFLGHRLGGRQESGAIASGGEKAFVQHEWATF